MTHKEEGNFTQVSEVFNNQEIFPFEENELGVPHYLPQL